VGVVAFVVFLHQGGACVSHGQPSSAAVLQGVQLAKHSGSRWLLDHVDCQLAPGARVALSGPSGAGKTLLLRALVLLAPGVEGKVLWRGQRVQPHQVPRFRSRVLYLPQKPYLAPGSVWENLQLPWQFAVHRHWRPDRRRAEELLELLGRSPGWLDQDVAHLSGGEAQVVALVRAVLLEPEVLLLDEPTAAMDPRTAQAAVQVVQQWYEQKPERAYLWVTHQRHLARTVADQQWQMCSGHLSVAGEESPAAEPSPGHPPAEVERS